MSSVLTADQIEKNEPLAVAAPPLDEQHNTGADDSSR